MSRIGQMPITVPQGVTVSLREGEVTVKGPKGELRRSISPDMSINLNDNSLMVSRPGDSRGHRSLHGLTRSLVANMVEGVTKGFEKVLEVGVSAIGRKKRGTSWYFVSGSPIWSRYRRYPVCPLRWREAIASRLRGLIKK